MVLLVLVLLLLFVFSCACDNSCYCENSFLCYCWRCFGSGFFVILFFWPFFLATLWNSVFLCVCVNADGVMIFQRCCFLNLFSYAYIKLCTVCYCCSRFFFLHHSPSRFYLSWIVLRLQSERKWFAQNEWHAHNNNNWNNKRKRKQHSCKVIAIKSIHSSRAA